MPTMINFESMQKPIYLDYNSTTPVDPEVLEEMIPYFNADFGNASSNLHSYGWVAKEAVTSSRKKISEFISCEENEIIFSSGATESINTIFKGLFDLYFPIKNEIITAKTEHKAVLDCCNYLEKKGLIIHYLSVQPDGSIDLFELEKLINSKTLLVSLMMVNNETGLIHPVEKIGEITRSKNTLFFSDLTQAAGKLPINVNQLNIDLACISAHKLYGPKGIGCTFKRRKNPRVNLLPLIHGGGHEDGFRSGTLNVPGIVGLSKASEIAERVWWEESNRLSTLRAKIEHRLLDFEGVRINGSTKDRVYNTSNICFSGRYSSDLLNKFNNRIAVSFGSACSSNLQEDSHVLSAMGLNKSDIKSSIRFSLGRFTTETEILETINILEKALED